MAISNFKARLMYKPTPEGEWTQLVPVKGTPEIGGTPNKLEITTNEDSMQAFIAGIKQVGDGSSVKANYEPADYDKLAALENKEYDYAIFFGNEGNGEKGKFGCKGQISTAINSSEVDNAIEMTITILNSTEWKKIEEAAG